jgi:UrcA family protein
MTRKMLVALAATMAVALPTAAAALSTNADVIVDGNTGTETRSVTVSLRDLNLADQRGYRMADYRITKAAKKVCGYMNGSIIPETRDYRTCFGDALDGARDDLNTLAQRS